MKTQNTCSLWIKRGIVLLCFFAVSFSLFGLVSRTTVTAQTSSEKITSFATSIQIHEDSTFDVREKIVYDFGSAQKHGIYRNIPVKYKTSAGTRTIVLSDIAVQDEKGQPYEFKTSGKGRDAQIKIGDADTYVTGVKTYIISYTVSRAVGYFDDYDEVYWNVTGNGWTVPIGSVDTTVELPQPLSKDDLKIACYAGVAGSTNNCAINPLDSNLPVQAVKFNYGNLQAGEGMTVAVGFPSGIVYKPTTIDKLVQFVKDNGIFAVPVVVLIVMTRLWWVKGRDPKGRGTVVAQYEAPDNLSPLEIAAVLKQRVSSEHISSEIIYLATQGYLRITKTTTEGILKNKEDYVLTKLKDEKPERPYDDLLIQGIFGSEKEITLSNLKEKFYKHISPIRKSVLSEVVNKNYYPTNPETIQIKYFLLGLLSFLLIFVFAFFDIANLAMVVSVIGSGLIIIIFSFFMPKVTAKGAELRERIEGLKLYMNVAEKDRINFHNAPEKNPAMFEKLLPYAMILGVEKAWAQQFESIYTQPPSWYSDASGGAFNALLFTNNLSSFNSVAASTMSTSAASGGSGSGGGGSSGGGFGGGGGGSW